MANKRDRFRELRLARGTQAQVARENELSTVYIRKIENGTCNPGRETMFKFVKYFQEPMELLFPDLFEGS